MDVTVALREIGEFRAAGLEIPSGVLHGLFEVLERREQLDELLGGLPGADAVAERVERFLSTPTPEPDACPDREFIDLAVRHLGEMRAAAVGAGLVDVVEVLDVLAGCPVGVTSVFHWDERLLLEPGGGAEPSEWPEDAVLSFEQVRVLAGFDEWLSSVFEFGDSPWRSIAAAFDVFDSSDELDVGGLAEWMLAPAMGWDFDLDAFYRIWEARGSLAVGPSGLEVVRGIRYLHSSSYSLDPVTRGVSVDDAVWVEANQPNGARVVEFVAAALEQDGTELVLDDLATASLPPSFFGSTAWNRVLLSGCSGLQLSVLEAVAQLPAIQSLAADNSGLVEVPDRWSASLKIVSFEHNDLVVWPENLHQATELSALRLEHNKLGVIPDSVGDLTGLQELDVSDNLLREVSPAIGRLTKLEQLFLGSNRELASLPKEILDLPDECKIFLYGTALPREFQSADTIGALRQVWSNPT